jgi:serine/threonine protein kinase
MDRYELQGQLGRGGMGVVYQAREVQSGRQVALKLLESPDARQRLARFEREGQVTAALNHPGIVRIHSTGLLDGKPYLAYELVEGARPFMDVIRAGTLRERVRLVRDVARALGYAHARGVIHRDVKPDNVLVDAAGRARVLDFGLAAHAAAERLTQTGTLLGTPHYMAPEQYRGEVVGAEADVWSLGVVLYEALTGARPFGGESIQELLAQVMRAEPAPLRELEPAVPADLEAVCLRALHAEPAGRYADGAALAEDLDAWLDGRRPSARPPRRTAGFVIALLAMALVAGGLAAWLTPAPAPILAQPTPAATLPPAPPAEPPPSGAPSVAVPAPSHPEQPATDPGDPDDVFPEVDENTEDRLRWVVELAKGGDPSSLVSLGRNYAHAKHGLPRDYAKAARLYERAAELGSLDGHVQLGELLRDGKGVPQDHARANALFELAAEAGDAEAKMLLGAQIQHGRGTPADAEKAARWYRRAVAQDHVNAKILLACLILEGAIAPLPDEDPIRLLEEASQADYEGADLRLGRLYAQGKGVPRDLERARRYLRRALDHGLEEAAQDLLELERSRQ